MPKAERKIRWMTKEELYAKMEWGTDQCAVENCSRAAALLVEESWQSDGGPDWWEYRCEEHARQFAHETGALFPAAT